MKAQTIFSAEQSEEKTFSILIHFFKYKGKILSKSLSARFNFLHFIKLNVSNAFQALVFLLTQCRGAFQLR